MNKTLIAFLGCALMSFGPVSHAVCPTAWDDAQVPIDNPQPPPPDGTPALTIDAIAQFVGDQSIATVDELLGVMPDAMRKNFALVEESRTGNFASLAHPRLILFGSDARLMLAVGTDDSDPNKDIVDIAELTASGDWVFRALDFGETPPALSADDSTCTGCHGVPARPIWGSYPNWPGMFGGQEDRLSPAQAVALNALVDTHASTARIRHLDFVDHAELYGEPYEASDIVVLADRAYPYTNTVFNFELGAAVADSVYLRIRQHAAYSQLRDELLVLGYCRAEDPTGYQNSGAEIALNQTLSDLGIEEDSLAGLYRFLGIDPDHEFSVHKFAGESPEPWNVATDSLSSLVELRVLDELMRADSGVEAALAASDDYYNGFSSGCFDDVAESVRYKTYQGWTLRTEARQLAREAAFDADLLRSHQGVFDLASEELCPVLFDRVANGSPNVDTDGDGVVDALDNCTTESNPDQQDTDSDNFGNICDPDFNNDGVVNVVDLGVLRQFFFTTNALTDLNGDGTVNAIDLGLLRQRFFAAPGPSGTAQAGAM